MKTLITQRLAAIVLAACSLFAMGAAQAVPAIGSISMEGTLSSNELGSMTDFYIGLGGPGPLIDVGNSFFGGVTADFSQAIGADGTGSFGWIIQNQSGTDLSGVTFSAFLDAALLDFFIPVDFAQSTLNFGIGSLDDGFQFAAQFTIAEVAVGSGIFGSTNLFGGPNSADYSFTGTAPVGSVTPISGTTPIPEPSSIALLGLGLLGLAAARRRKRS